MEPLTAFFILEGLFFDAIGGILIVNGLFNIKINLSKKTLDLYDEFDKNTEKLLGQKQEIYKKIKNNTVTNAEQIRNLYKLIGHNINASRMVHYTVDDANTSNTKKSQLRGQQGLYFLLCGFLLQGIGVVNQLS